MAQFKIRAVASCRMADININARAVAFLDGDEVI